MRARETDLERALRAAADDPASRPDFYRVLIESEIYVIGETQLPTPGAGNTATDERVRIQNWTRADGTHVIPFFASLPALQRATTGEANYIALQTRTLFELTEGATLVLNPKSDYGKEFLPPEIKALLLGGVNRMPEQRVMQQETKVLLGQPAHYPTRMVDSLTTFFRKRSQVKAAYLVLMHDTAGDAKPHLVIGIVAEGDIKPLFHEAGAVAGDTSPEGEPVDLFHVVAAEKGLSEYFLNAVSPFYERSWRIKLNSIFSGSRA